MKAERKYKKKAEVVLWIRACFDGLYGEILKAVGNQNLLPQILALKLFRCM